MNARLAIITFVDAGGNAPVDPGYGVSAGGRPDQSLPGSGARPDQGLPGGGGHPSQGLPSGPNVPVNLPVYPFDPTIDNSLPKPPGTPTQPIAPTPILPGARFMVKWLACAGLILVPDNSLPTAPAVPGQELPPTAQPKSSR